MCNNKKMHSNPDKNARGKILEHRFPLFSFVNRLFLADNMKLPFHVLSIILSLFLSACSSDKPVQVANQSPDPSGTQNYKLEIVPKNATRNTVLYLVPHGFEIVDSEIGWLINGEKIANPVSNRLDAGTAKKGDRIQVISTFQGKEIRSNVVTILNSQPVFSKVRLLPEVFHAGDNLFVEATVSDPDEDKTSVSYQWTVNGEPKGDSKKIEEPLKRGDKVSVKITPSDGEVDGSSIVLHREITNIPPMIAESKKYEFEGNTYSYTINAVDPDGDTLTYALTEAPKGMKIDAKTGLITWNVPKEITGKTPFTVSVTDGQGGLVTQKLTLVLSRE